MAGQTIFLTAPDGHRLSAYEARPDGDAAGGCVLLQEIFGLTDQMRRACVAFAARGYHVVAPALFDRIRPGIALGYSQQDALLGRTIRNDIPWDHVFADVEAAKARLAARAFIAAIGYCWGGTIAWRCATAYTGFAAAVCYYPTGITPYVAEEPRIPVLAHFGERDPIASLDIADRWRGCQGAAVEIHVYPAGHGFSCDDGPNYDPVSAELALARTLALLDCLPAQHGAAAKERR